MSRIRANQITNKTADGAITATNGLNVTGVCTATSFSGIVPSSSLNGALPALDGSALTGISQVGGATGVDFNDDIKARFGDSNELTLFFENAGNRGKIGTTNSTALDILTANTQRIVIENNGHVRPATNNDYDLGTSGDRWRNVYGVDGNFNGTLTVSGNVSIGGTLTYEDVTNVDSVGIVTAREGIRIKYDDKKIILGADDDFEIYHDNSNRSGIRFTNPEFRLLGATGSSSITLGQSNSSTELSFGERYAVFNNNGSVDLFYDGTKRFETTDDGAKITGKLETTYGLELEGFLKEEVKITAGKLSDNTNINLDDGMVYYFTTQETTTSAPNVRFSSSASLNSKMAVGDTVSVTIITTAAAAGYSAQLTIDGSAVTENWVGGSAPSGGGSSGVDIYTYNIIKTADATFTVIANLTKTS